MDKDKFSEKEEKEIGELIKKPFWEDLPAINERVKEVLQEDVKDSPTVTAREAVIPKIKGLETLKESVFTVDLEKTVNDMFTVIKNMEAQLERVMTINSHLEKDRDDAKEMVAGFKAERSGLEAKIAQLETDLPAKREMEMEIEQLIDNRNSVQEQFREQKEKIGKMQDTILDYQRRIGDLEEEKRDAMADIKYLETRLNTASKTIESNKKMINELKGEKMVQTEKIKVLEDDLKAALDDRYNLLNEVKKSKKAMAEFHSAISDKKLKAKKSYYQSTGE